MQNQFVFEEKKEIDRLCVQNRLLSDYEEPVFRELFFGKKNLTVLDVGCNDGKKTAERFSSDAVAKVIGLEYNESLARDAGRCYGGEKFSFYSLNVETPSFTERLTEIMHENGVRSFDLIYLSFVLMHLTDAKTLLSSLKPFLSAGGSIVVLEANDKATALSNDKDGLLDEFLNILKKDKYSGNREIGANVCEVLAECGYESIYVWHDSIPVKGWETEKKDAVFTIFFSYLPEDVQLLLGEEPENAEYRSWSKWLDTNYGKLKSLIIDKASEFSVGIKILTCTKERE